MSSKNRILSGVQPSGDLHLRKLLRCDKKFCYHFKTNYECFFCVVDLHAITVWQDPNLLMHKKQERSPLHL